MTPVAAVKLLAMLAMLGVAVFTDLRERRIPNKVTLSGAVAALLLSALEIGGIPTGALLGLGVALAVSFPAFALGALGAGDAKLLAAVGAFVGGSGLFAVLIYSGFAGGLLGLASAIRRGVIIPVLLETKNLAIWMVTFGHKGARRTIQDPEARTVPYGVAIAVGAVLAWIYPIPLGGAA
jgi:prepilin peptidase CpaA